MTDILKCFLRQFPLQPYCPLENIENIGKMISHSFLRSRIGRSSSCITLLRNFLTLTSTESATLIMSLEFVKTAVIIPKFRKILVTAECVKIDKHGVALNLARILNTKMIRVGKH